MPGFSRWKNWKSSKPVIGSICDLTFPLSAAAWHPKTFACSEAGGFTVWLDKALWFSQSAVAPALLSEFGTISTISLVDNACCSSANVRIVPDHRNSFKEINWNEFSMGYARWLRLLGFVWYNVSGKYGLKPQHDLGKREIDRLLTKGSLHELGLPLTVVSKIIYSSHKRAER